MNYTQVRQILGRCESGLRGSHVFPIKPPNVAFAQYDVIQHLTTKTADPLFRNAILPHGLRMVVRIGVMLLTRRNFRTSVLTYHLDRKEHTGKGREAVMLLLHDRSLVRCAV